MRDERLAPCGTEAAYERHRRHGETPCAECKRGAAAARARRRGASRKNNTPMAEVDPGLVEAFAAVEPAAGPPAENPAAMDFKAELARLYRTLGKALTSAAPRETASIVREMRGTLRDLKAEIGPAQQGPSLKEQLAQMKRDKAAKQEERERLALAAGGDA